MKAIGAAQDFEGRGMVIPEGDSKPKGGVGTSVPANEAAKTAKPSKRLAGATNQ
jgi:hypothetical protein